MNEKIKQIYLEAYNPYSFFDYEKFANLIVEECARTAAATACPYQDEQMKTQLGHTWDMACVAAAREVRKKFGAV